jgi:AcrR family transcriptional regulator
MATTKSPARKRAVRELKRNMILDAARKIFETEGLDGASLRAIAAESGYTPAALYFHFDSKEAIYSEVLAHSLSQLAAATEQAAAKARAPERQLQAAAMAFFDFYAENPRDLDLGFYLFRGGMRPNGLGRERDEKLNDALLAALRPIADAATRMGASPATANRLVVDIFAHATGLLLLTHTGRIRMFDVAPRTQMKRYVDQQTESLRSV